jgi:hypothetical protein
VPELPDYSCCHRQQHYRHRAARRYAGKKPDAGHPSSWRADHRGGSTARQEDRQTIATARAGLEDVTRQLHGYVVSARRGDEQNRWLIWTAIGGVVVGVIVWAVFAGIVARAVPASGNGRKMAARSLDLPMWEGGQRLMRVSAPGLSPISRQAIVTANRRALEACRKRADQKAETVRCIVNVEANKTR